MSHKSVAASQPASQIARNDATSRYSARDYSDSRYLKSNTLSLRETVEIYLNFAWSAKLPP